MAARKPYLKTSKVKPSLFEAIKNLTGESVGEEELRKQRVSFAFGNAMGIESITKESVKLASKKMRIVD